MATDLLLEAVRAAAAELDTDKRAWVIGIGRLGDNEGQPMLDVNQIHEVLQALYENGDYPLGPMAYAPDYQRAEVNPIYHMVTLEHHREGRPYLETKIGFGIAGYVAQGFTRSGILEDHEYEPSHVLLVDVEALIADTATLLVQVALAQGYLGPCALIIGVVSDVPGHPLRLRSYDATTGELLPPDPTADSFVPVAAPIMVRETIDRAEFHRILYGMSLQAAHQFGAQVPQLFLDPQYGTPEEGVVGVQPPGNPFGPDQAADNASSNGRPH